jgi:hypothetical protein
MPRVHRPQTPQRRRRQPARYRAAKRAARRLLRQGTYHYDNIAKQHQAEMRRRHEALKLQVKFKRVGVILPLPPAFFRDEQDDACCAA